MMRLPLSRGVAEGTFLLKVSHVGSFSTSQISSHLACQIQASKKYHFGGQIPLPSQNQRSNKYYFGGQISLARSPC